MDAIASFEATTGEGLSKRQHAEFYRVTPVKGARVDGTFAVGASSDEIRDPRDYYAPQITVPAIYVDYTPQTADNTTNDRAPLTVNGKTYGEGFGNSVSGRVEFLPVESNAHLGDYYQKTTVAGVEYYVRGGVSYFDGVSDAARKVLSATAAAIAAEFMTDERWHAYLVRQAEYRVERARKEVEETAAKLAEAEAELATNLAALKAVTPS